MTVAIFVLFDLVDIKTRENNKVLMFLNITTKTKIVVHVHLYFGVAGFRFLNFSRIRNINTTYLNQKSPFSIFPFSFKFHDLNAPFK